MFVVCLLAYFVLGLMEREVRPAPPRQYPPNPFSSNRDSYSLIE